MKWQGKGVSEGLAMAKIHLFTPKLPEISRQPAGDPEAEVRKLEKTLAAAQDELHTLYETAKEKMGEKEAEIFDAHLTILNDEYSCGSRLCSVFVSRSRLPPPRSRTSLMNWRRCSAHWATN